MAKPHKKPPAVKERVSDDLSTADSRNGASLGIRVTVAGLLALTSILGAGVISLAVKASIRADELDRAGFSQTASETKVRAKIFQDHREASLDDYLRWLSHSREAHALAVAARHAPGSTAVELRVEARANYRIAGAAWRQIERNARGTRRGRLTLGRADQTALILEQRNLSLDLDPNPEFHESNLMRTKSERLAGLAALLLVSALLFTLPQILRKRAYRLPLILGLFNLSAWTIIALVVQFTT
jgi:hypothetical protein